MLRLLKKYLYFRVEKPKPKPMPMFQANDLYVVLEVNIDNVKTSEPMLATEVDKYISEQYADQPLRYFNESRRIKIVHLRSGEVRVARITIQS
jgi:hypothetical protein